MSTKAKVTNSNFFDLLSESVDQGVAHAKGKVTLNSAHFQLPSSPPAFSKTKIKEIRENLLRVSQPVFASILGCTSSSVKSWERGENQPNGATKRLLQIIEKDPSLFLQMITEKSKAS